MLQGKGKIHTNVSQCYCRDLLPSKDSVKTISRNLIMICTLTYKCFLLSFSFIS